MPLILINGDTSQFELTQRVHDLSPQFRVNLARNNNLQALQKHPMFSPSRSPLLGVTNLHLVYLSYIQHKTSTLSMFVVDSF